MKRHTVFALTHIVAAYAALYLAHSFFPTTTRVLFRSFAPLTIAWRIISSAVLPPVPAKTASGRLRQIMKKTVREIVLCAAAVVCAEVFIIRR